VSAVRFHAIIEIRGVNPYVRVSSARAKKIKPDWRRPLPVLVRVNGEPEAWWRINLMPTGDGDFYLYLHASVRQASHTQVGDRAAIELRFDSAYKGGPAHTMPPAFTTGLRKDSGAQKNWRALSPSRQKEILRYFASLKSASALARNIARALHVLSGEAARFMGRAWADGR
jgi:hypothetical protein